MIFKLHAETPIVQGYLRSCVYDLPRQAHDFLPNEVAVKFKAFENAALSVIDHEFDEEDKKWFSYVVEKEYGFTIDEAFKDCFPKINFNWAHPALISNAIIDIQVKTAVIDFSYLEQLNCKHLLLRFFDIESLEGITGYLKDVLQDLTFKSIDVVIEKNPLFSKKEYTNFGKRLLKEVPLITGLSYNEAKANEMFVPRFVINIDVFSEAQQHNTFFNRKLYLAGNGDICNAIEHPKVYGNLKNLEQFEDLEAIVSSSEYQELWHTSKDNIDVCRDCEFRYMCIDNRLPRKKTDGSFYYEEECAYNPYIAKWFGEDHYRSLEETGINHTVNGLQINAEKIAATNEAIWAE